MYPMRHVNRILISKRPSWPSPQMKVKLPHFYVNFTFIVTYHRFEALYEQIDLTAIPLTSLKENYLQMEADDCMRFQEQFKVKMSSVLFN